MSLPAIKINTYTYCIKYAAIMLLLGGYLTVAYGNQLPDRLTAAILLKIIEFDKRQAEKNDIHIHVISDEELIAHLKQYEGRKIGQAKISKVTAGVSFPDGEVDVVFIGKTKRLPEILKLTRNNKVTSISSIVEYSAEGVSVVIFDDEGVPGILLNTVSSKLEGASWDPEILEVANVINEYNRYESIEND